MTVYVLKLIAVVTMLIDHSAWLLFLKGLIGSELYMFMRAVGRVAFPVFCYLLVNGFDKSRDRLKYLSRLILFAALSQIPYSLVFTQENYFLPAEAAGALSFAVEPLPLLALTLGLCAVWFFLVRKDGTVLPLAALLVMGMTQWTLRGVCVMSTTHLNVFYTLALAMAAMCLIERIKRLRWDKWYVTVLLALCVGAVALLYGKNIDYSYSGLILLLMLYFLRGRKPLQALALLLWCAYTYLLQMTVLSFAVFAALSCVLALLYNGKLGAGRKWFFYVFYPAHLTILAILIFIL